MKPDVRIMMERARFAAEQTGLDGYSIAYKHNANGEHVVAVIWPTGISPQLAAEGRRRREKR